MGKLSVQKIECDILSGGSRHYDRRTITMCVQKPLNGAWCFAHPNLGQAPPIFHSKMCENPSNFILAQCSIRGIFAPVKWTKKLE